MSNNKKYYYLKLKENFFDTDEMVVLESMQDGHLYSNILLKLYLRSLKNEGKLMFNDRIPYSPNALAQVTRHSVGVVEKALNIFRELGLVEILDNGAIYLTDIQNFIGESTTEADRKRLYRKRIDNEKLMIGQMSDECPDKSPPETELEIETELELETDKKMTFGHPTLKEVLNYANGSVVNGKKFYDYYAKRGWLSKNKPIKDWQKLFDSWEEKERDKSLKRQSAKYTDDELEQILANRIIKT